MKKTYGFIAFVVVLVLFTWTAFGQKKNQPRGTWEYKLVGIGVPGERTEQDLNKLGVQGWELVSASADVRGETTLYLRRAK
jgi:hypothetical protein